MNSIKKTLVFYGAFLMLVGLAGYLSNPEKAKTALISGGTFGTASFALAFLFTKRQALAKWLSLGMLVLLSGVFVWRSTASWQAVITGNADKTVAAILISSMLLATVLMLGQLFRLQFMRKQTAQDSP